MIFTSISGLDELAFEGRNKNYGAYHLRKRYPRYLLISLLTGIAIISVIVITAWLFYYFHPVSLVEGDMIYDIQYYSMSPPPQNESDDLAQAYAKPIQQQEQVPVVTDSVKPEEPKSKDDVTSEKTDDAKLKTDSAAKPGGSGLGEGVGEDSGIASAIDVFPRFPGGDDFRLAYLRKMVRYPEAALKDKIQGVVMVLFVVETDGSLSHVDVVKRIGGGCDEEAMRVTREMPHWEPGKRNGRAVRVMVRMPIVFRIPGRFANFR